MKEILKKTMGKGLSVLEKRAERKANAECMGFVYEPKVPKKLKKTICMGLAVVMTVVGVLASSVGVYEAATNYDYASWNTIATNPAYEKDYTTVKLLFSPDESYKWAVTSCTQASGYGLVELTGSNVAVTMHYGYNNKLTAVGAKTFDIGTTLTSGTGAYAIFGITMDFEGYMTSFTGYVEIV